MTTLLIAEHDNASIKDATNKALTAAAALGAEVHVLVAGENAKAAADAAAKLAGVKKVLLADNAAYAHDLAEPLAALIVALAPSYDAFVAPATSRFKNVMPRVAALLDVMQVSEIIKVVSPDTFERPIYAGNAIQTVKSKDAKKVITVRTSTFAAAGDGGDAAVENAASAADPGLSSFVGEEVAKSDRPELTSAKIIVSGGRAMQSRENFAKYIEPLADKLGAGVGASRAAVDAGYAPNDWQVGQTGKVVAPELYIAIGISGAIQHLAGMKDSKVIVAINKDEDAPIFQVADYGLVADLYQAVPELTSAKIIVSGGRAMQSRENFAKYIEPLADKLGAGVGASRAAVDAGYAPNDWQVGQTGKVVAPELYVAIGISGAIQHLAGMKDSKIIVAINKDADAPIFQVADYGLVADYKTAVPELMAALTAAGI